MSRPRQRVTRQLCSHYVFDIPKVPGVYCIFSRYKKERYFGSTIDLNKRFRDHLFRLIKGNHRNAKMQKCFRKKQIMFFTIICFGEIRELQRAEQRMLDLHKDKGVLNFTRTAAHHHGRNFK